MPIINSKYVSPKFLSNGHLQTMYPFFFRKVPLDISKKERIITQDKDFLDLDEYHVGSDSIAIISHGLEGSANTHYIKGMARYLNSLNIDALAWNMRSCSGELNLTEKFYHSGASEDLDRVVQHVLEKNQYKNIYLVGFSLGANLTATYVGEYESKLPKEIKKSILISNPCDLKCSSDELKKNFNKLYLEHFLWTMKQKVKKKEKLMGFTKLETSSLHKIKCFDQFNNMVTAPLHGFIDSHDYYQQASCKQFLATMKLPTLLINAKNDPFFGEDCYPIEEAKVNKNLFLEMPESGGHMGFVPLDKGLHYWHELRAGEFLIG